MRHLEGAEAADAVIVGAGVAGLAAALALADPWRGSERRVLLVTKTPFAAGGNSVLAQGGVAAALAADDSPELHAADTVAVAGGLADPRAVAQLVGEGRWRVLELLARGARFDREASGGLALGREAAHSRRRIVHADGDATGREMVRAMALAVSAASNVDVLDCCEVLSLGREADPSETAGDRRLGGGPSPPGSGGARLRSGQPPTGDDRIRLLLRYPDGRDEWLSAAAVVLATGGIGQLYRHTTNPAEASADGLALAARAGAELVDLEMVQFHPTALAPTVAPGEAEGGEATTHAAAALPFGAAFAPLALLTEALRGEGALLLDAGGVRFMVDEHPLAELAPRDVLARAIALRVSRGEPVFLDARPLGARVVQRFPSVTALCRARGLDPARDLLPVVPAAHYHMGGVAVDADGRTSVPALWACGEVAASGVHGANRLASNSLLEALVWGARVGEDVARAVSGRPPLATARPRRGRNRPAGAARTQIEAGEAAARALEARLRTLMDREVGVVRTGSGLRRALAEIAELEAVARRLDGAHVPSPRLANLLLVGRLIATAALERPESRGAHFRSDYPESDPAWARRLRYCVEPGAAAGTLLSPAVVAGEVAALPAP